MSVLKSRLISDDETSVAAKNKGDEAVALLRSVVSGSGGSQRPGQEKMVREVAETLEDGGCLLIQAGTGTGKSLGYLVPALAHAVASGRRVVVSTATLALQNQLVSKDLPTLERLLKDALGREITWQTVKGRSNYVCKRKMADGGAEEGIDLFTTEATGLGAEVLRMREWAEQTENGERDDLVPGVSERAWRQVSVSASECLGAMKCSMAAECFSQRARVRAAEVDVIITNHALIAVNAQAEGGVLPEHDVLILDEAHELTDRITSSTSLSLSGDKIQVAVKRARRMGVTSCDELDQAGLGLEVVLGETNAGWKRRGLDEDLENAVLRVRSKIMSVSSELESMDLSAKEWAANLLKGNLGELYDACASLLDGGGESVVWVEKNLNTYQMVTSSLHVAPLSVAEEIRMKILEENRSTIMTSATLTVGNSFESVAGAVGLSGEIVVDDGEDNEKEMRVRCLDVGSPFQYGRQGILYVARDLSAPGRDGADPKALVVMQELIEAAGGRTLGLFSSRKAAENAAAYMRANSSLNILCQGEDTTSALVGQFSKEEHTCLFGTLGLWQGVDVSGVACQLVIIDRIPFARPDDPLMSARQETRSRNGGNGFMDVGVPKAAIMLAQGAGRLIRTENDRGMVAVLDSRLANAKYAKVLRDSLPPFWTTYDHSTATKALRRLTGEQGVA